MPRSPWLTFITSFIDMDPLRIYAGMVFHKNLYRCRVILGQLAACVNVAFINHDDNSLSFVEIRLYVCLDVDQMTECAFGQHETIPSRRFMLA